MPKTKKPGNNQPLKTFVMPAKQGKALLSMMAGHPIVSTNMTAIMGALTDIEQVLKNIPYQHKLVTRVSSANHCKKQIDFIRRQLSPMEDRVNDKIQKVANSLKNKATEKDTAGFVRGYGYNSDFSGNYYYFLGADKDGRLHFYREFSGDWERLSRKEALKIFHPEDGKEDKDFAKSDAAELDLDECADRRV